MPATDTIGLQASTLGAVDSSVSPKHSHQQTHDKKQDATVHTTEITAPEPSSSSRQPQNETIELTSLSSQQGVQYRGHIETEGIEPRRSPSLSSTSSGDEDDETTYPEGGFAAWRVVFGSFLGMFSVLGLINSIGAVQAYVSVNQLAGKSESQVSWVFSVFVFLCYLLSGQVGPLFDAYGPYHLGVMGTALFTIGLMMTSLCTKYYQFFLAFSLCCGVGCALLMTPQIACVGHFFNVKRGVAIGTATIGGSLGGVVFPIFLRRLYSTAGYAWAIRGLAFMCFGTLSLSLFLLKTRLKQETKFKFSWKTIADFSSLKDMRFTFLILANFLGELGVVNGITFLTSYAIAQGKSEDLSYALLTILNTLGMLGRWLPGIIADKLGRFNTLIATTTMAFLTIFIIWLPFGKSTAALIVFAVLHGFCAGGILSLAPVCCGQICRTQDYGSRYGTMYVFTSFGVLLGVPLSGALIRGSNYNGLIIFTGSLYVATTAALIVSRYYAVGMNLKKW